MIDLRDPRAYCEYFLKIRDKRSRITPLKFKPAQELLYEIIQEERDKGAPVRIVVLKGRQLGSSTLIEGLFFADSATSFNAATLIMAHDDDSTRHLFSMNKLFYDELPERLKPMRKASNAQELVFENPTRDPAEKKAKPGLRSRIRCRTAGAKGAGRGFTYKNVHGSEVAFWPDFEETHLAVMQAVPDTPGTTVVYETTANGFNGFKEFWDKAYRGENEWRAVFLPWYLDPDYVRPVAPGVVWTDYEQNLMETMGLTPEQLSWRRHTIANKCNGSEDLFQQEYPTFPEEAFLTTGRPFFDVKKLNLMMEAAEDAAHVGFFEFDTTESGKPQNIRWVEDARNGYIRLWADPVDGVPYVLGGDTAGDGSDFFTGFGIDNTSGVQVCSYHLERGEKLFTQQMWCLGAWYNWALLAVEVNYGSYCTLMLEEWGYPNLYQRQRYDDIQKKYLPAYGYRTDANTRPLSLSNLRTVLAEHGDSVKDCEVIREAIHFEYDDKGKPQATTGYHDDYVMAAAICHMARGQQSYKLATTPEEPRKKLPEQLHAKRPRMR